MTALRPSLLRLLLLLSVLVVPLLLLLLLQRWLLWLSCCGCCGGRCLLMPLALPTGRTGGELTGCAQSRRESLLRGQRLQLQRPVDLAEACLLFEHRRRRCKRVGGCGAVLRWS